MAIHIIDEANRCLNCKKPKCMEGCPVQTPVPHIIQLFKEHQVMDAGRELFENNPMSLICSIVCNHEMQCARHSPGIPRFLAFHTPVPTNTLA